MSNSDVEPIQSANAVDWNYSVPKTNGKMLLLTIGNILVTGQWQGALGEYYKAWAKPLRRDKELEKKLGLPL